MSMKLDKTLKSKVIKAAQIALAAFLLMDIMMHYKSMHHGPQIPIPPVTVKKPQSTMMVEYMQQTGNTVAFNSVNLVARIPGYLDAIEFTDGTFVKKGQNLFIIEPEPYMAQLLGAKASLAAQKAIESYDKAEYARQQRMYKENATSLNNVEKWLAKSHESEAEVAKAAANVEIAEINYSYTHIAAPFNGRIGRHLVDIGNYVGNGAATHLATIEQLDPIYVYFNLNELDFIKLRTAARNNGVTEEMIKEIPVDISLQNASGYHYEGKLNFVNTGLNAATGTMEFRALLPNKNLNLVPGLFVDIQITTTKPSLQLTVPNTAVLYDQIGSYVLVADKENKVVLKRVVTGSLKQGQRAILKGINAQDNVIINGLQNATPGNLVAPQQEKSTT